MRILLDTHVFLWAVAGSSQLKAGARKVILDADMVFVSAASIWEVAIKARLGKIEADPVAIAAAIEASGVIELPGRAAPAAKVPQLPMIHNDPFDRLLVAQAITEPLRLLTRDPVLSGYTDLVQVL
jgi:PIN domain nuclease of toxin-antitoxin system